VEVRYPVNFAVTLRKTMTNVRHEKELWLFNCARLDKATEASLERLGTVTNVVSMSSHKHHDAYFQERFNATLWTIEGLEYDQDGVECKFFNADTIFPVDDGVKPLLAYSDDPSIELKFNEAVVFLPSCKLLIACDIIQNEFREEQFQISIRALPVA